MPRLLLLQVLPVTVLLLERLSRCLVIIAEGVASDSVVT